jgi:DNA-binding NarL/FixJ family response regulator
VTGAIRAGAIGYLLKTTKAEELIRAIRGAAAGQVQLAPEAAARLMREVRVPEKPEELTERETEVLRRVARGQANKEIAHALLVEETTINYEPIYERVETPEEMGEALASTEWDVIVSDYQLPRFSAPEALQMARRAKPGVPFVVVSGKVGEEAALEAMKAGRTTT